MLCAPFLPCAALTFDRTDPHVCRNREPFTAVVTLQHLPEGVPWPRSGATSSPPSSMPYVGVTRRPSATNAAEQWTGSPTRRSARNNANTHQKTPEAYATASRHRPAGRPAEVAASRQRRRVWDSNPRRHRCLTGFQDQRHRPLGEPSRTARGAWPVPSLPRSGTAVYERAYPGARDHRQRVDGCGGRGGGGR